MSAPRNYGLMLNFDFFQLIKHHKDYSVGVLYLALLNLPRHWCLRWENVIAAGIVPIKELISSNEFLKPAVDEMKDLWKGVHLNSCLSSISLTFRVLLYLTNFAVSRRFH